MKKIHYLLLALVCGLLVSCADGNSNFFNSDWDAPATDESLYGNSNIQATNVMTIAALKTKYKNEIDNDGEHKQITDDVQIKGVVTANDIEGNMYNEISVQDKTGAIFIGISQGGVFGYLPVGTEILIDLKGLYIGNYRKSATIGVPYLDNKGVTCVGRTPRMLWAQHFKLTGYRMEVEPEVFADGSTKTTWDIAKDAGKLCILKNVTIKKGGYYDNETKIYVDNIPFVANESTFSDPKNSTSWYFNEQPDGQTGGVQIYTSSYADFAAKKLPTGKINIIGIAKRYKDQWEIIARSYSDIQEVK